MEEVGGGGRKNKKTFEGGRIPSRSKPPFVERYRGFANTERCKPVRSPTEYTIRQYEEDAAVSPAPPSRLPPPSSRDTRKLQRTDQRNPATTRLMAFSPPPATPRQATANPPPPSGPDTHLPRPRGLPSVRRGLGVGAGGTGGPAGLLAPLAPLAGLAYRRRWPTTLVGRSPRTQGKTKKTRRKLHPKEEGGWFKQAREKKQKKSKHETRASQRRPSGWSEGVGGSGVMALVGLSPTNQRQTIAGALSHGHHTPNAGCHYGKQLPGPCHTVTTHQAPAATTEER